MAMVTAMVTVTVTAMVTVTEKPIKKLKVIGLANYLQKSDKEDCTMIGFAGYSLGL